MTTWTRATAALLVAAALLAGRPAPAAAQPEGAAARPCDELENPHERKACLEREALEEALEAVPPGADDVDIEGLDHPDTDPDFDGYSDSWTGAFVGVGAFGGPAWTGNDETGSETGWTAGVAARMNMVLSLFDFQLDYRFASFETTFDSAPVSIGHHALGAALGVHPLFLLNFGADRISYALAAFYIQVGISFDLTAVRDVRAGTDGSGADWGINIGFGGDFPLTNPDVGDSLWLGALYRLSKHEVDVAPFDGADLTEHIAVMSLSWRHNGLIF